MEYFSQFPLVTDVIDGQNITKVDISYATLEDSEDYSAYTVNTKNAKELGSVAKNVYADANSFWGLMFANDETNPWTLILQDPYTKQRDNQNYSGIFGKHNATTKTDPNAYVTFLDGDILVSGAYYYGATAAKDVIPGYDLNTFTAWYVQKSFTDTKKAKITRGLNFNSTVAPLEDISQPGIMSNTVNYVGFRESADNDPIIKSTSGTSGGNAYITNLAAYYYDESPAYFTDISSTNYVSPTESLGTADTILSVISDDSPSAAAVSSFNTDYKKIETQTVYNQEYLQKTQLKYILESNLGTILNKLV